MIKKVFNILTNILLVFLILIIIFNLFSIFYSKMNNENKEFNFFHYEIFIDVSNSMSPIIEKGDLVIAKQVKIDSLNVGDIIVFNDLKNNITITHRTVSINTNDSGEREIITKGDMNDEKDETIVNEKNFEAKYVFKISHLGTVLLFFSSPIGIITFILIIITIFAISHLFSILKKQKN